MGWFGTPGCYCRHNRRGGVNRKATLDSEFSDGRGEVLSSTMKGTTYYAVYHDKERDEYTALVVLTHVRDGEFWTKTLTERDCPLRAVACPRSYIEFLDEHAPIVGDGVLDGYARDWRARCLEHADEVRERRRRRNALMRRLGRDRWG